MNFKDELKKNLVEQKKYSIDQGKIEETATVILNIVKQKLMQAAQNGLTGYYGTIFNRKYIVATNVSILEVKDTYLHNGWCYNGPYRHMVEGEKLNSWSLYDSNERRLLFQFLTNLCQKEGIFVESSTNPIKYENKNKRYVVPNNVRVLKTQYYFNFYCEV